MDAHTSLSNHFLIAMPSLADPNFSRTVTFLCDHSADGALGIVINRGMEISLGDIFEQTDINTDTASHTHTEVHYGGPVQRERGFVLHEPIGRWQSTLAINETLGLTTSRDILAAIANDSGPDDWFVALGYAGWGPGQLESEIAQNAWLHGPAEHDILFRTPIEARWQAAAQLLGVDLDTFTGEAGHA